MSNANSNPKRIAPWLAVGRTLQRDQLTSPHAKCCLPWGAPFSSRLEVSRGNDSTNHCASRLVEPERESDELAAERFRVRPASLFGPAFPGPWRQTRRFPAVLEGPAWVETTGVIRLPVGYRVDTPPVSRLVTPFAEYAAGFAQRDRRLHYSRRFVLKQHVVGLRQWEEFYSLVQQIQDIEQAGVVVGAVED